MSGKAMSGKAMSGKAMSGKAMSEIKKVRVTQYEVDGERFDTKIAAEYHIARQRFVALVDEYCWSDMDKEDVVRILWDENLALMVDIFKPEDMK